jgi:RNA polymerase sigma-70 factor (ECF subfamily)
MSSSARRDAFGRPRRAAHRRELLASTVTACSGRSRSAEDLVQEAFLRRVAPARDVRGRASVRAWLTGSQRTPASDALDKRAAAPSASGEVAWLQPYPDELFEQLPDGARAGGLRARQGDVELAFIAAIQHLAPLPRAVLVLRDVLGCSAKETARLLETTRRR